MSKIRVRFAPSPTGELHVGGARTALFNWLFARSQGGTFILRVEDTDDARNTPEANAAIFSGLKWLELDWDEGPDKGGDRGPYRQSERKDLYDRYLQKLEKAGLVYDEEGAIRFRAPNTTRVVEDIICGDTTFADRTEPDMTIRRPDGSYIFHFVNVVDDIEMGVTHVIRGEDHLSNTPRHLDLYEAFGAKPPKFGHIPLILNPDGSKMSKRDRGASVQEYMNMGFHPAAVVNYLALLGWSPKDGAEVLSREQLVERFNLAQINRGNARFDYEKCEWFSGQYIGQMTTDGLRKALNPFLKEAKIPISKPKLPDILIREVQPKIRKFSEAAKWISFLYSKKFTHAGEAFQTLKTRDGIKKILASLISQFEAADPWNEETCGAAIDAAATELSLKKGALMFPCRVAVSGQTGGISLLVALDLLGKERSLARLRDTLDHLPK